MIAMKSSDAEALFRPYVEPLRTVVEAAWSDWGKNPLAAQIQHRRVRANAVWNQFIARAKREFPLGGDVRVEVMKNWEGLLFKDIAFVRFKKASKALFSSNYQTAQAIAFHDTEKDLLGNGVCRLELVYVLDKSELEIERICLVQRHKRYVAWTIDLKGGDDGRQVVLPFTPRTPSGPKVAERVLKRKRRTDHGGDRKKDGVS
jgi:hypothetical protein